MIEGDHRDHPSGLDASYILPLRRHHGPPFQELTSYLRWLAPRVDLVVVDGSPDLVRRAHAEVWRNLSLRHVGPDAGVATLNGKVAGVLTGLRLARCERVIVADGDVRYDESGLRRAVGLLDAAEVVRPQNYFDPCPWHARWDTARTLLNRAAGGDYPGTLAVRRSAVPHGYDGDVLFENLELIRTVRAGGGRVATPLDCYVRRLPPHGASLLVAAGPAGVRRPGAATPSDHRAVHRTRRHQLGVPAAVDAAPGHGRDRDHSGRGRSPAVGRTGRLSGVGQRLRAGLAARARGVLLAGRGEPPPARWLPLRRSHHPPGRIIASPASTPASAPTRIGRKVKGTRRRAGEWRAGRRMTGDRSG